MPKPTVEPLEGPRRHDQAELRRYDYNRKTKKWTKTVLGKYKKRVLTWNITSGEI